MFTKKCHCMCPYRFPYMFATGLRQVSDRFRTKSENMYQKCKYKFPYRFPYRFTTGLRQVSDIIKRFQKCLPKSVTACVPTCFPTGLRQVCDRFPTGSGENPTICTKNVDISFPTGFPTGLRQVYDRSPK